MFDAVVDLEDTGVADRSFRALVECATRARDAGRFGDGVDPVAVATQIWASGHGLLMLTLTGVLGREALDSQARAIAIAICTAAGRLRGPVPAISRRRLAIWVVMQSG